MQTEHNKKMFLELYCKKSCNISETCEAIGIGRTTYYDWIKGDPAFRLMVEDNEMSLVDMAESQLMKNIKAGKEVSLIFFLTNRAPDRWKHKNHLDHVVKPEFGFDFDMSEKAKKHFEEVTEHLHKRYIKDRTW